MFAAGKNTGPTGNATSLICMRWERLLRPWTSRDPDGPCQFMGQTGCTLPRWLRAFKCTWYFCEPLLAALDEGNARKARRLSAALQEMVDLYNGLNVGDGEKNKERRLGR